VLRLTMQEKAFIEERAKAGVPSRQIAREMGRAHRTVHDYVDRCRQRPGRPRERSRRHLGLAEREEISRGLSAGRSIRSIAAGLGRPPSTVCREVDRNGGRRRYRACAAEERAWAQGRRPRAAKLAADPVLRAVVEEQLELQWSPQQIAGRLVKEFPDQSEMRVSHETIYMSLFVQARGALRKDLTRNLRRGHASRRPRGYSPMNGQGQLRDTLSIRERPAEAEDRAVPGHWEGDLVFGRGMTAMATLVERHSRFLMLVKIDHGHTSPVVTAALARRIVTLPEQLRRSLTWDQGKEMALHAQFVVDTGLQVYFCDPKSPWQRGSNENTNGLLRQYFPKGKSLAPYSQADLDEIAARINGRPRHTLGFMTPSEKLNEALR
jgi:IS30 family transposase